MKKTALLFILMASSFLVAGQFNLGIKNGISYSRINYTPKFQQRNAEILPVIGYTGGFTFQYFNQSSLGVQIETLYIQKGFKTKYDTITNTQYERKIDYISLPFLMHAYAGKKKYQISLLAGFYGGYIIKSEEILTEGDVKIKRKYSFTPKQDNRFEFGLQGGLGLRGLFSFGIFQIEGHYSYTLTSLYKWETSNSDPDMDRFFPIPEQAQNQGYQITLSFYKTF